MLLCVCCVCTLCTHTPTHPNPNSNLNTLTPKHQNTKNTQTPKFLPFDLQQTFMWSIAGRAPTPWGPNTFAHHPTRPPSTKNKKMAKCGLTKFGRQKLVKFAQMRPDNGQIRIGQIRPRPFSRVFFSSLSGSFSCNFGGVLVTHTTTTHTHTQQTQTGGVPQKPVVWLAERRSGGKWGERSKHNNTTTQQHNNTHTHHVCH